MVPIALLVVLALAGSVSAVEPPIPIVDCDGTPSLDLSTKIVPYKGYSYTLLSSGSVMNLRARGFLMIDQGFIKVYTGSISMYVQPAEGRYSSGGIYGIYGSPGRCINFSTLGYWLDSEYVARGWDIHVLCESAYPQKNCTFGMNFVYKTFCIPGQLSTCSSPFDDIRNPRICDARTNTCCLPNCDGRCAGDDGCGGQCTPSICDSDDICYKNRCCTPKPRDYFCPAPVTPSPTGADPTGAGAAASSSTFLGGSSIGVDIAVIVLGVVTLVAVTAAIIACCRMKRQTVATASATTMSTINLEGFARAT